MQDLIAAIIILSSSPDMPVAPVTAAEYAILAPQVRHVALRMEIMDGKENGYMFTDRLMWNVDILTLRRRYAELLGAPLIADSFRFPDYHQLNEQIRQNRVERREWLARAALELDRADALEAVAAKLDAEYRLLDAAADSRKDWHYVQTRRLALMRLRDQLAAGAWAAGELR